MDSQTPQNHAPSHPAGAQTSRDEPDATFYDATLYSMDTSVGLLIKRAHLSMVRTVDMRMQPYDLTALQWGPLLLISKGYDTVAACAREACTDASSMTRMLDRLEAKGLLRRTRNSEDRRVVNVELTEAGKAAAEVIPRELAHVLNQHLRGFTAEEFETLKSLLRRFERNGTQPQEQKP